MSNIEELAAAFKAAKKAFKADKTNKELKVAKKAAKAALEAAKVAAASAPAATPKKKKKRKKDDDGENDAKRAKVVAPDIPALEAALKAAKAAKKANKGDKALKAAFKAAKAALAAAKAPAAEPVAAEEPVAEADEEMDAVEEAPKDELAGLMKKKPAAAAAGGDVPNDACEKIFVGNLSWDIDDDGIKAFFKDCGGELTDIFWLTDRDSGKFKGCGFITFDSVEAATKAVAMGGTELMGREIKTDFAKPRANAGGGGGAKKGGGKKWETRELSEKPEGCTTVFCGNLSFSIDDDAMYKFVEGCGEVTQIRWLTNRDTGDFKGCGFLEFDKPESVDLFVKKNGQDLMGRPIHIDYAKPRAPKENSW